MFSGFINRLFGSSEIDNSSKNILEGPDPIEFAETDFETINIRSVRTEFADEDDWLIVNTLESEESEPEFEDISPTDPKKNLTPEGEKLLSKLASAIGYELIDELQEATNDVLKKSRPGRKNEHRSLEESWFLTPPPCFMSTGPIYMETSPFENLLIEHPSMSVYHCITYMQQAENKHSLKCKTSTETIRSEPASKNTKCLGKPRERQMASAQNSRKQKRFEHESALKNANSNNPEQLKKLVENRPYEKVQNKREHGNLCRTVLKRGNKVRDVNGKANRRRRSDMQHCRILSGANNNRKC